MIRSFLTRIVPVLGAGILVATITPIAAPDASGQRGGGGEVILPGQRGTGGSRGPGMPPAPGARRGGPSATASRIDVRSYYFAEANANIEYAVFVSSKVKPDKKTPLVIGLHGLGNTPSRWLPRLTDAIENAGFIIAAPMGYTPEGGYGANGPGRRGSAENIGELSEKDVFNVLDIMRDEFNIDERRIYLAGHSMGGAGALYLGIKHKGIWAAIAASAPAIRSGLHTPDELAQAIDLPMIVVHGDKDELVPVEQSRAWVAKMKELKMTFQYIEIKGGGHGDMRWDDVFRFFKKHVKPEAPK